VIRALVADDHDPVRGALAALVDSERDMLVVAQVSTGQEAVERARATAPDVVLPDIRVPVLDGTAAARRICGDFDLRGTPVLVLTTFDLDEYVHEGTAGGRAASCSRTPHRRSCCTRSGSSARGRPCSRPVPPDDDHGVHDQDRSEHTVRTPRSPHGPGTPDRCPGGAGTVRPRDLRTAVHQSADGQDPRQPRPDGAGVPGPRPTGQPRLRARHGPPRAGAKDRASRPGRARRTGRPVRPGRSFLRSRTTGARSDRDPLLGTGKIDRKDDMHLYRC